MARRKYKNKHKHSYYQGNKFYSAFDEEFNKKIINEIRKYSKNGEVENECRELVNKINFDKEYFFDQYENTIANHIIGRIFVSHLNFILDELKRQTLITKRGLLRELGFEGKKVSDIFTTAIHMYPTPRTMQILKRVGDSVDDLSKSKCLDYDFGLTWPIEEIVRLSFEKFYRVSGRFDKNKDKSLKQDSMQKRISKTASNDLDFLKQKALSIGDAQTIEEVVDTANQILKLAEILRGQ